MRPLSARALPAALVALLLASPARAYEEFEDPFQEIVLDLADHLPTPPKVAPAVVEDLTRAGRVRVLVRHKIPQRDPALYAPAVNAVVKQLDIAVSQIATERQLAARGYDVKQSFRHVPFTAVEIDAEALAELEASGLVESVQLDPLSKPMLYESTVQVGADQVWQDGYDGTGVNVAVLDTGVYKDHTAFSGGAVVAEACFSANGDCPNGQTSQIGSGAGANCSYAAACDHGTHVAGIVAGRPTVVGPVTVTGVAPGAGIIAVQVFSEFSGASCGSGPSPCTLSYGSDQIAALEWLYDNRVALDLGAVNMSLGGGKYRSQSSCDDANAATKAAIDQLRAAHVPTFIASGNDGYKNDVSAPGCISSAIAVGSTTKDDEVSSFSNHGGLVDLMAPGSGIAAALPPPASPFGIKSGTSMATPHMAGAYALMLEADRSLTVDEGLAALKAAGPKVTRAGRKRRRLEVAEAIEAFNTLWMRSPARAAVFGTGTTQTVSWFPQEGAATYTLYASKNNGKKWTEVATGIASTSHDWQLPADGANRTSMRLSVRAYDGQGARIGPSRAKSPGKFTSQTVRMTSHNASANLLGGGSATVSWQTYATDEAVTGVRIFTRKQPGQPWKLAKEIANDPGSTSVPLPVFGSDKSKFRLRVELRGASGSLGKDNNDANLTLLAP